MPYLALLSMLGFLATDMYLPAFGAMQQTFNTSPGLISASMSLFLAGFACGQLFWGPLSDRIGRKPVLLAGLTLFAIGCAGMLWVNDIFLMLALIALALILTTLRLPSGRKAMNEQGAKPGFFTLLKSRVYSGNVLIYSACSASFFAWLTGSPFILADLGLSYLPQTVAFLICGFGCRALLNRFNGGSCCRGCWASIA